jgi:hypothetical protein
MKTMKAVWVRFAGNARMIRENGAFHWRCFPGREAPEIPLRDIVILGTASAENFRFGTDPASSNPLGLTAWFDGYGELSVADHVATIVLRDPA